MYNNETIVCSKCLIHETFFMGGSKWAPTYCPKCGGVDYTIYNNLSFIKKMRAKHLFKKMWRQHK